MISNLKNNDESLKDNFSKLERAFASNEPDIQEVRIWLTQRSKLASKRGFNGNTLLHLATIKGQTDLIELAINHGCSIYSVNAFGQTPLHAALVRANERHLQAISLLLSKGADLQMKDNEGNTALDYLMSDHRNALLEEKVKAMLMRRVQGTPLESEFSTLQEPQ